MKLFKWLAFWALALALLFTFCACSEGHGTTKASNTTGTGTPQTPSGDETPNNSPDTACQHQYGEWSTVKVPTCTEAGEQSRTCTLCGKSETGYINALGHNEVEHAAKLSCTTIGWDAYITCSRCDYSTFSELQPVHDEKNQDLNCLQCVERWGQLEYRIGDDYCAVSGIGTFKGTELNIPNQYQGHVVTSIDWWAFERCTNITSVTIPRTLKTIGGEAFSGCTGLKSVAISDSVTSIESNAFWGCIELNSITVDKNNSVYHSNENCIIETASKTLLIACKNTIIPNDGSVVKINDGAFFGCKDLTSIVIPNSVTSIGSGAFYNCTGLAMISIPDGVTELGNAAFSGCSSLTSITIPKSVTSIGLGAFTECVNLTNIIVDDNNTVYHDTNNCLIVTNSKILLAGCKNSIIPDDGSVIGIGPYAFSGCAGLTNIALPDTVMSIDDSAFSGCAGLRNITIPKSVSYIGFRVFEKCTSLASIVVDADNLTYHSNGNCLIETESKALIVGCKNSIIPNDGSVTAIGGGAFSNCIGLTNILIPNCVTDIGSGAFSGCSSLTNVIIPQSVTRIGGSAFENCTNLTNITILDGVTEIGIYVFSNCTNLTSITIPKSVTSIGLGVFEKCTSLTSIVVDADNLIYHSSGNCLIETESKILIAGCKNSIIPDDGSVTVIGNLAFFSCIGLTNITIPDSITKIESQAFYVCSDLKSITIPDNVTHIGHYAFSLCTSLENVTIPSSVTSIYGAFQNCTNLVSIYYKGTVQEFQSIKDDIPTSATVYFYAPDGAPDTEGNYWHYVNGVPTPW